MPLGKGRNHDQPGDMRLYAQLRRVMQLAKILYGARLRFASTSYIHGYFRDQFDAKVCERTIRRDLTFLADLGVVEYRRTGATHGGRPSFEWRWSASADHFLASHFSNRQELANA